MGRGTVMRYILVQLSTVVRYILVQLSTFITQIHYMVNITY